MKLRRQATGMTLQDFSEKLIRAGEPITTATLSNYETGKTAPSEEMLDLIAEELGMSKAFFMQDPFPGFEMSILTPLPLVPKQELELKAFLQIKLEQRLSLDKLLKIHCRWAIPEKLHLSTLEYAAIDELCSRLRGWFGAGDQPISSVCGMLENLGYYVLQLPKFNEIKSLMGYVHEPLHPFAAVPVDAWPENARHDLLRALAYTYIETDNPADMPQAAHYFASAMLLPKSQILRELGSHRTSISFAELAILKKRYGISRYNILQQITKLGYYPLEAFQAISKSLGQHGFSLNNGPKRTDPAFSETPESFRMRIVQALTERLISQEEALQLYPFQFESWIY